MLRKRAHRDTVELRQSCMLAKGTPFLVVHDGWALVAHNLGVAVHTGNQDVAQLLEKQRNDNVNRLQVSQHEHDSRITCAKLQNECKKMLTDLGLTNSVVVSAVLQRDNTSMSVES